MLTNTPTLLGLEPNSPSLHQTQGGSARAGVDVATLAELYGVMHPTSAIAAGIFVIGHVIGTILLGIALWCSRTVPRAVAAATAVSQPLHFMAAVILGLPWLDLAAWGLNAIGFAAVSLAVLRVADDMWDVPPAWRSAA